MGILDDLTNDETAKPVVPQNSGPLRITVRPEDARAKEPSLLDTLSADYDANNAPKSGNHYGQGQTALMHGIHGATSGFSDEAYGAMKAAPFMQDSPAWALPVPRLIGGLAHLGYEKLANYFNGTEGHEASDAYTKGRDEQRKALEESAAENPWTAGLSDVAGSLAVPGGSFLKPARMGERALRAGVVGGIQGGTRGAGDAPELKDVPEGIGSGTTLGVAFGAPFGAAFGRRPPPSQITQDVIDTANKYGVKLPQYMVSDSDLTTALGQRVKELPFVGGSVNRAADEAHQGVSNIGRTVVDALSNTSDRKTSELAQDATSSVRKSIDDWRNAQKEYIGAHYDNVGASMQIPNARVPMTNLSQEFSDQIAQRSGAGLKSGPLLNAVKGAVTKLGGMTYEDMKYLRTALSQKNDQLKAKGGTNYAEYVRLRNAITKDMEDVLHAGGGQKAMDAWAEANAINSASKNWDRELGILLGNGNDPFGAVSRASGYKVSDPQRLAAIDRLRHTLDPQSFKDLQAAAASRLIFDEAGNFSPAKFITAYGKGMSDPAKNKVFGPTGTPVRDAMDAMYKLSGTLERAGKFANRSGTAPAGATIAAAVGLIKNPLTTIMDVSAGILGSHILARPVTSRQLGRLASLSEQYLNDASIPGRIGEKVAQKSLKAFEVAARNYAISLANQTGGNPNDYIAAFTGQ